MIFEEVLKDKDIKKIVQKVCHNYSYAFSKEELKSYSMEFLWKACLKYDPSRGCKFTTYVYKFLTYKLCRLWTNKQKKKYISNVRYIERATTENQQTALLWLDYDIEEEYKQILSLRLEYLYSFTHIGKKLNINRETVRRKYYRAIREIKEIERLNAHP